MGFSALHLNGTESTGPQNLGDTRCIRFVGFCSASQVSPHIFAALPYIRLQSLLTASQRTNAGVLHRLQNQHVLLDARKLRDSRQCPHLRMVAIAQRKPYLCYRRFTSQTTEATHPIQNNIRSSVSLVHSHAAILSGARTKCRGSPITQASRRSCWQPFSAQSRRAPVFSALAQYYRTCHSSTMRHLFGFVNDSVQD